MLEMFTFELLPYNYAGHNGGMERTYRITIKVNGEEFSCLQVAAEVPAYMSEIEFVTRMALRLKDEVQKKVEG